MSSKELWMIDLEGTLTDNRWRQHLITGPDKNWKDYYKGLANDPAVEPIKDTVCLLPEMGIRVIVYTTRMPNKYNMEKQWLLNNNMSHMREILFRENTKLPGPQLLRTWCEELRPNVVIDDRPDNRNAVRDIVPIVWSPEEFMNADLDETRGTTRDSER